MYVDDELEGHWQRLMVSRSLYALFEGMGVREACLVKCVISIHQRKGSAIGICVYIFGTQS